MKKKKIDVFIMKLALALLFTIFSGFWCYGQNGTYQSLNQVFKDSLGIEINYASKTIIIIDINRNLGGNITFTNTSVNQTLRYEMTENPEVSVDRERRLITSIFSARLFLSGVDLNREYLADIIEDMDSKKIQIWIYSPIYKTYMKYKNISKL